MANTDLPFEQEVTDPVTTSIENARRRFNEEFFIKPSTSGLSPAGMLNIPLNPPDPYIQQPFRFEPLMANQPSSVVGGMFSPEISRAAEMQYLQGRQKEMRDRALAFAQLSPMQQADYGFYRGGQQLGDVVGGALGGKDPQLQMIGLQQQILSELDPSDPEQQLRVAQKYARTAPDLAMKIAESARKSMSEMALTTQRLREKQGADPFQQLLRSGKYTPASMATYEISGNVADLREVDSPDKVPADIQKARLVAQSKGFKEGTKEYNDELVKQLEKTDKRPTEEIFDLMAELDVLDPVKDKKKYDIVQARIDKLTKGKSLEESLGEGFGMLGKALAAGQKKEAEETGKYTAENFKNLGSAVAERFKECHIKYSAYSSDGY